MPYDFWPAYWAFSSFIFGATVGSFLNVCIWRLPRGESLADPPSHCPACKHRLHFWPDMIPLFSQLWQRGRCRYCGVRFSWRYFWVELVTALLFTAVYLRYPEDSWSSICGMLFVAALVAVFVIDLDHFAIISNVVYAAVLAAVVKDLHLISIGARPLWQELWGLPFKVPIPLSILWGLIGLWLLWQFAALATAAIGQEAMGSGDSILLGAMGAFLIPWPLLALAFITAVFLGAIGGIAGKLLWEHGSRAREAAAAASDSVPVEVPGPEGGGLETLETADPVMQESKADEPEYAAAAEEPEWSEPSGSAVGTSARGAAMFSDLEEEPGEAEAPRLPPGSRWGRLWTVLGTWVALIGLWGGAALYTLSPGQGIGFGCVLGVIATVLLVVGHRMWTRSDEEWLPAMDDFMGGEPGPSFIPFGPYLVAGTLLAMFFGRPILEWYASVMSLPPFSGPWD
jgi:leader peptidase (prepilin peptidase)/N-methyltransferase